jgi:DtxR family Mn-dependent transcriptional regulator
VDNQLTPSQENYLEHILNNASQGQIRVRDLARSVGVKLPSVTRAVQKLSDAGMVKHRSYGTIEITNAGKHAAQSIARRDQCLSRFLSQVLDLPPDQAKDEACRIEHVISEDVVLRLEILVQHLSKSTAWRKKLRHHIQFVNPSGDGNMSVSVGQSKPHT